MTAAGRNEPCPCGSARKYKRCCLPVLDERKGRRGRTVVVIVLGLAGLALAIAVATREPGGPAGGYAGGRVWSVEHGHWHYPDRATYPQPLRDPLPASGSTRVWSEEHGHFHDVPATPGAPPPEQP